MKRSFAQWKWLGVGLVAGFGCWAAMIYAATDTDALSGRIARSLGQALGLEYIDNNTIAISRIKKRNTSSVIDVNELIDYSNVKIVQTKKFRVTDRTKLQLILNEQRIQLAESVTPNEYKELGKILGVDLFIYGTLYNDALVLKAIDVQHSHIAWAEVFAIEQQSVNHLLLHDLREKLKASLKREASNLLENNINNVSFWNLEVPRSFSSEKVMDYLTVSISKDLPFQVIDRENLKMIAQEQQLNQAVFIDESQARELGNLYGVDAFLYGKVTSKGNNNFIASMKMMSIFTGVILWADLINFTLPTNNKEKRINPFEEKARERQLKSGKPPGMVRFQGGTFLMGSDDARYDAAPEHLAEVNDYWMDAYEVTNDQYQAFVQSGHRAPTSWQNGTFKMALKDHPVVGVSWEDAKQYCEFLKKRLPTEAEWERALRGPKGRKYSWQGPNFSQNFAVTLESGIQNSVSVKSINRDVTPEKIYHLVGNVREYVADVFRPYPGDNRRTTSARGERVVRGSSWAHSAYEAAGFYRGHTRLNLAWPDIGFRCAR